jgi:hypothetical protein
VERAGRQVRSARGSEISMSLRRQGWPKTPTWHPTWCPTMFYGEHDAVTASADKVGISGHPLLGPDRRLAPSRRHLIQRCRCRRATEDTAYQALRCRAPLLGSSDALAGKGNPGARPGGAFRGTNFVQLLRWVRPSAPRLRINERSRVGDLEKGIQLSCPYSPKCLLLDEFCEPRLFTILGSPHSPVQYP